MKLKRINLPQAHELTSNPTFRDSAPVVLTRLKGNTPLLTRVLQVSPTLTSGATEVDHGLTLQSQADGHTWDASSAQVEDLYVVLIGDFAVPRVAKFKLPKPVKAPRVKKPSAREQRILDFDPFSADLIAELGL